MKSLIHTAESLENTETVDSPENETLGHFNSLS